ncbi:aldehyde dehydrogenase (NADP(+)) [Bordetella bronchiseptica]|uniref:aldehyde dehydrogenase (NADP(+)) n=1 Tax=Bordetella bronchiseptica TaxID=518 RepID=UPI0039FDCD63
MTISGAMMIGRSAVTGDGPRLYAFDPNENREIEPAFSSATRGLVDAACDLAARAFDRYRGLPLQARAGFLERIAANIERIGDELIQRAHSETGLPRARLEGERARTVGQLRLFAEVVGSGHWLNATLDSPQPDRQPAPRPDLRMARMPVGPVAVFGASNFPLAFSVAGGDTASALAAGCPVVVKAHSAHLGTSELVARAVQQAGIECDMPDGVFSLVVGPGAEVGSSLVAHPAIKAVGFTGSRQGGLALVDVAARRKEPIPVYAEMSSVNPFFVLPGALARRAPALAAGLADSIALGAGQFCTNPGLIVLLDSEAARRFVGELAQALGGKAPQTMLTAGIARAYGAALERRLGEPGVEQVLPPARGPSPCSARPALFAIDAGDFMAAALHHEEIFGPASVVVYCRDRPQLHRLAESLEGQLTSTLHFEDADRDEVGRLLPILEKKAGRLIANGYPTGVEVSHAMVHGGPFPSTSNVRATSVGASAIDRFLRPVCYQDFPSELVPAALQDGNPLALWRLRDGRMQQG